MLNPPQLEMLRQMAEQLRRELEDPRKSRQGLPPGSQPHVAAAKQQTSAVVQLYEEISSRTRKARDALQKAIGQLDLEERKLRTEQAPWATLNDQFAALLEGR